MRMKVIQRSLATMLTLLVLVGCQQGTQEEEAASAPTQVSVMTLKAQQVTLADDLPGRVAAVRTAEIRPQVGGIIQRRLFEQGAEIQAGQPLFQINPAPFKAEVDMAEAALKRAEAALSRARVQARRLAPLVKAEAVSRQTYDDAVSQRDQAAADVAQARATLARRQLDLTFATVDAPIDGRIDQALVSEGALVGTSDSTPLARIQQIDQVYVDVRQSAAAIEALRDALVAQRQTEDANGEGLHASILRSNGKPYPHPGKILFSGINVEASTGDVLLRIQVDNPERLLLPGMFVRVRIPRAHHDDALLVPQQAIARKGGKAEVWVVDEQNQAKRVPVVLGELVGRNYVIQSGLQAGQRIVVEGGGRLTDDAQLSVKDWNPIEDSGETDAGAR